MHNQLIAKTAQDAGLASMTEGTPNLLDGMDASGAALYRAKRWWRVGRTPTEVQLDGLKTWLDTRPELQTPTRQFYATDSLVRDYAYSATFADVAFGAIWQGSSAGTGPLPLRDDSAPSQDCREFR